MILNPSSSPLQYKCIYCGTELDFGSSNNPFDEGLHAIPDKYSDNPSVCCGYCNAITSINRNFKRLIEQPENFNLWIHYIKEEINELEKDKNKVITHYLKAKGYDTDFNIEGKNNGKTKEQQRTD